MTTRKKKPDARAPRASAGRSRQRRRLIDACIAALHIHGPSRTTVEKVVAIAKMSPGIVRFYFDSKAAMLVASLQFLAAEFEDQVMAPVANLKATPVVALSLLVDLYLDAEIASPRKVSVWYAFWGEASSRQEYYDICGQQDESFATLVQQLIHALITETAQPHLDPDGIALGLIGVLEVSWQDIAFQTERDIDRVRAKRRAMAFLRSVFPGCFESPLGLPVGSAGKSLTAFDDPGVFALERKVLFQSGWSIVGHACQIPRAGDYLTLDIGVERVLVVQGGAGKIDALRNSCPESPHELVTDRSGRFGDSIACKAHGLTFDWDGKSTEGSGAAGLVPMDLSSANGLLFVKRPGALVVEEPAHEVPLDLLPHGLLTAASSLQVAVAADWKEMVESWLKSTPAAATAAATNTVSWNEAALARAGWSVGRYLLLAGCTARVAWTHHFLAPNHLLEVRPDGLSVMQVVPTATGHCLLRRFDYTLLPPVAGARARALQYLARRIGGHARRATTAMAESIQRGRRQFGYEAPAGRAVAPGVAWFREYLRTRVAAPRPYTAAPFR